MTSQLFERPVLAGECDAAPSRQRFAAADAGARRQNGPVAELFGSVKLRKIMPLLRRQH